MKKIYFVFLLIGFGLMLNQQANAQTGDTIKLSFGKPIIIGEPYGLHQSTLLRIPVCIKNMKEGSKEKFKVSIDTVAATATYNADYVWIKREQTVDASLKLKELDTLVFYLSIIGDVVPENDEFILVEISVSDKNPKDAKIVIVKPDRMAITIRNGQNAVNDTATNDFYFVSLIKSVGNTKPQFELFDLNFKQHLSPSIFLFSTIDLPINAVGNDSAEVSDLFTEASVATNYVLYERVNDDFIVNRQYYNAWALKYFNKELYWGGGIGAMEIGGPLRTTYFNIYYLRRFFNNDTDFVRIQPRKFADNIYAEFAITSSKLPIIENLRFKGGFLIPWSSVYNRTGNLVVAANSRDIQVRLTLEVPLGGIKSLSKSKVGYRPPFIGTELENYQTWRSYKNVKKSADLIAAKAVNETLNPNGRDPIDMDEKLKKKMIRSVKRAANKAKGDIQRSDKASHTPEKVRTLMEEAAKEASKIALKNANKKANKKAAKKADK